MLEHAEQPYGQQPSFLCPWLVARVGQDIPALVANKADGVGDCYLQCFCHVGFLEYLHFALNMQIEHRARLVGDDGGLLEHNVRVGRGLHIERLGINERGRLPLVERVALHAGRKEQGKLAAFGSKPQPLFAAEDIDVAFQARALGFGLDACLDQWIVYPAATEAVRAAGRRGHHAALPCRHKGDLRAGRRFQQMDLDMFLEKGDILAKRSGFPVRALGHGLAGREQQCRHY